MKKTILVLSAAVVISTPAFAEFYIVQEPTTKRCRIVEERPAPSLGVVIGERGFGVRTEAESHLRTVEICRETTSGQRAPAEGVIIQEGR